MEERTKSRPWIVGVVGLALLVAVVLRNARRQSRESAPQPVATLEIDGKTLEITTTLPGATVQPVQEREEVVGRAGIVAETSSEPEDFLVEVVRPDGGPAAGATVAMLDALRVFAPARTATQRSGDPDEAFERARRATADARGMTRLPRPRGNVRLAAWHEGSYGELALFPGEPGPVRLVLAEDPPIEVRVVSSDGSPLAQVPVVLRTAKNIFATRLTRQDGTVSLYARGFEEAARVGAFVQLGIPLREAVFAPVHAKRDGPIELVAPALGAVDVRLMEGGAESQSMASVRIGITEGLQTTLAREAALTGFADRVAFEGRARFEHVGLGLELFARVAPEGREKTGREFPGPTRAGEVVACSLDLSPEGVFLTGRLIGSTGAPLREVSAEFRVEGPDGSASGHRALTDDEGNFRVAFIGSRNVLTAEELEVAVLAPFGCEHAATLPVQLVSGANELGDLHLERSTVLVSGRVRDEGGAPVKGLPIEALSGFNPAHSASGDFFAKIVTDALGRFALHRNPPDEGGFALRVRQSGFFWGTEAVAPGTSDLEIVVRQTGSIAVEVLHAGGWKPIVHLSQRGVRVGSQTLRYEGNSLPMTIEGLLPGTYDLEWSHGWAPERGFVRGVNVVAGEKTIDPRLTPLDLRAVWPRVRLVVVDESDHPVAGVRLELWRDGSYAPYTLKPGRNELDVVAGPLPLRARLSAPGFQTRELELEADSTVVLTRGPRLEIVAPTLPELPRDWEWAVWVRSASLRDVWPTPITLKSGVNELTLERSGSHELWVGAVRRHGDWNDEVGGGPELEFVVAEGLTTVTLEALDAAQVDAVRAGIAAEDPFAPR